MNQVVDNIALTMIDEPRAIARMAIEEGAVRELADSISQIGLLQPIVVRPGNGRYEIIAGHRRFLAHKMLGLSTIRSLISEMTDEDAIIARASENLARVDLTPIEEAAIYRDLMDNHHMTPEAIGKRMGKSPAVVMRRLDLLKMPPELQQAVHLKQLTVSAATELWPITDHTALVYYLSFAIENGCTKEVAREWCKSWRDSKRREHEPGAEAPGPQSPYEPRPVYIACTICNAPVKLGDEKLLRICSGCDEVIKKNM